MEVNLDFETYLFLSHEKISISVLNKHNLENLYYKELINNDKKKNFELDMIDFFFEKNIFEIEKKLNNFIKHINLIIDKDEFLTICVSVKKNNYGKKILKNDLIYLLNEAKDDCKESINEKKIIHMLIDNYLLDKKCYSFFPVDQKCNLFSLDIRFICLSENYIRYVEKNLKKYQISIKSILQADYIRSFQIKNQNELFQKAKQIVDGYNQNEVLIVPKKLKNLGLFERFFNFFS